MVGILIVAHAPLASAFMAALQHVYKKVPEHVEAIDVVADQSIDHVVQLGKEAITRLNSGEGVLVLTDMLGATPANCCQKLSTIEQVAVLAGLSLPMLLRALTYRHDQLEVVFAFANLTRVKNKRIHRKYMVQIELEIVNKLGLHARASAKLTQLAAKYNADVWVSRNNKRVNGKSIMGVMMLAAGKGSHITLDTEGTDEKECSEAIANLVAEKFGESE